MPNVKILKDAHDFRSLQLNVTELIIILQNIMKYIMKPFTYEICVGLTSWVTFVLILNG